MKAVGMNGKFEKRQGTDVPGLFSGVRYDTSGKRWLPTDGANQISSV